MRQVIYSNQCSLIGNWTLEANFNEIWIKLQNFSYQKCVWKWRSFCTSLNLFCEYRTPYSDVKMGAMASQITGVSIVCSTVCSGVDQHDQRMLQSFASLAFVRGIHRWPVDSPHKGPGTPKMLPFDDVIMIRGSSWLVRCLVVIIVATITAQFDLPCMLIGEHYSVKTEWYLIWWHGYRSFRWAIHFSYVNGITV